jgi:hypothetical protein
MYQHRLWPFDCNQYPRFSQATTQWTLTLQLSQASGSNCNSHHSRDFSYYTPVICRTQPTYTGLAMTLQYVATVPVTTQKNPSQYALQIRLVFQSTALVTAHFFHRLDPGHDLAT